MPLIQLVHRSIISGLTLLFGVTVADGEIAVLVLKIYCEAFIMCE